MIVTFAPPAAATGENETSFGSTLNGYVVLVVPPAFVTAIGPSTAPLGTVTFNDVPPTPTLNGAATVPLNFTLVVPVKVFPARMMWAPATPSFGAGSPLIVGRTFNVVGLFAVPSRFVALTVAVRALSGTVNWKLVAETEPGLTASAPSLAVRAPLAVKFDPLTITVSPAR